MRIINFKTLEGKNFLSFGDKSITVNLQPGVNAIVGTNYDKEDSKNGVGKTTIINLLTYCLYGSTLNDIPKDHIQNSFTNKRCEAMLTFDVVTNNLTETYKIHRFLNPTKCVLYKNDQDITRSTLAKTNEFIQNLLRTPFSVFQNSVVTSVNNTTPFMALSKTDKRKFIESILGLELFSQMILKARDQFNASKKDYDVAFSKFEILKKEYEFNSKQLETYETELTNRTQRLEEKKAKLQADIEILNVKLEKLSSKENITTSDLDKKKQKLANNKQQRDIQLNELMSQLHKVQADTNNTLKQIKSLQTNKDFCPTCNTKFSQEHVNHIQETIAKLESSLNQNDLSEKELQKQINEIKSNIEKLNQQQEACMQARLAIQKNTSEITSTNSALSMLSSNLKETQDEISSLRSCNNNELKGKIATLTSEIQSCELLVNDLNNNLNILESVKFILSEEGIKSFIVKKILKIMNSKIAFYLKQLDANCLCQFNEFFEEQIVDEKMQSKSYFNFSGGERKRIDLACLFAFSDIRRLQGDVNFNTVFYDELFDSSLDDKGVNLTLNILRERYSELSESCYVITHRSNEVMSKANHTIHLVKKNGITSIKN